MVSTPAKPQTAPQAKTKLWEYCSELLNRISEVVVEEYILHDFTFQELLIIKHR